MFRSLAEIDGYFRGADDRPDNGDLWNVGYFPQEYTVKNSSR
jgi:hypothetical protein